MKNVLIYGSCVSRDILRLHPDRFKTSHYIARQSWISAYSRPVQMPKSLQFKSAFVQRSIEGDFKSDALRRIRFHAEDSDVLLMDLATDRRGYLPIGGSAATISFSREIETSNIAEKLSARERVEFGSHQHFGRFTRSAMRMKNQLKKLDIFGQTIILRVPFVDESTGGHAVPRVHGKSGDQWNRLFIPYYEILEELGFYVTDPLPMNLAIADSNHTWGIAPDHYIPRAYEWWAEKIDQVPSRNVTS